jgi:hypothetical protein
MMSIGPGSLFADWPDTNAIKFVQMPDLSERGMDIAFNEYPMVLADDFTCTNTGPVTDIHLWVSSIQNVPVTGGTFTLSIWDDVPGSPATGLPSHPGSNLWSEVFAPGMYQVMPWADHLLETFWDFQPVPPVELGPDNKVFVYNFYPQKPFTQGGTANKPVIYWLGVSMQAGSDNPPQGWKTSPDHGAPDKAVLGHYNAVNTVTDWRALSDPRFQTDVNFAFALTTPQPNNPPPPCCLETNGVKFAQRPNINGVDVNASQGITLADDFQCTNHGTITDIHLWGSWINDAVDPNTVFTLGIWSDVPSVAGNPNSHPGVQLWTQTFQPGQYALCPVTNWQEQFDQPAATGLSPIGGSMNLYYLCFYPDPAGSFQQTGTATVPTNYWLSVSAQTTAGTPSLFGWKSSIDKYNDAAVWTSGPLPPPSWNPMADSFNDRLNLSFKITTDTNQPPPPPPPCIDTNTAKFIQFPNIDNGLDVWDSGPWVLADDFKCVNPGPITDIHIWGSWKDNLADTNTTFTLAIYDDVPAGPNNLSHPGNLLWTQGFGPGTYAQSIWGTGQESFFDPGAMQIMGPEQQVWYYCFHPPKPFVQAGTTAKPILYWLMVYGQPADPTKLFGWKTTPQQQFDISVHEQWLGAPPPTNSNWQPTFLSPTGGALDLAFKLDTYTNLCPIPLQCQPSKRVECGTPWNFDPPVVGVSPCCGTIYTVTFFDVTNNAACPLVVTRTWIITDCTGQTASCSQTVAVFDSTPPTITCAPDKTVECGIPWTFDTPTVSDRCCPNVTLALVSTNADTAGPCRVVWTATWEAIDCCSNISTCTERVYVVDTTPPDITCPTNMTVKTCGTNVQVFWSVSAADKCGTASTSSTPPSGTFFPANSTNTVVCQAWDQCGNTNMCQFTVAVVRPVLGAITITYASGFITIHWTDGILQQANNVVGPYSDVLGASPPTYSVAATNAAAFYRVRCLSP